MADMGKVEKVVNGLEFIRDYDPIMRTQHDDIFKQYAIDAIALLDAIKQYIENQKMYEATSWSIRISSGCIQQPNKKT